MTTILEGWTELEKLRRRVRRLYKLLVVACAACFITALTDNSFTVSVAVVVPSLLLAGYTLYTLRKFEHLFKALYP